MRSDVRHLLHRFVSDKSGVTAIEYALVASMIVLVIIVAEGLLGTRLAAKFTSITGDFS
jgi:pilus assembly protein Flp/PilA